MTRTLLLIFAFIALTVGSFIWFVATWDRDAEVPVSGLPGQDAACFALVKILESGPATCSAGAISGPYAFHTLSIRFPYAVFGGTA